MEDVDYTQLLSKLVAVAVSQGPTSGGEDSADAVNDAVLTIGKLLSAPSLSAQLLAVFLALPQLPMLVALLCSSAHAPVRQAVAKTLKEVATASGDAFAVLFDLLSTALDDIPPSSSTSTEYFLLLNALLSARGGEADAANCASMIVRVIAKLRKAEKEMEAETAAPAPAATVDAEDDENAEAESVVVLGCLRLLRGLCQSLEPLQAREAGVGAEFAQELFDRFLFTVPTREVPNLWPVARGLATRSASLGLLATLARDPQ
jgi:hypothetical protein